MEHDITIGGQQIDLCVSKSISGVGHKRWVVECKWTQKKSISNQEAYNFANFIGAMRQGGDSLDGIMITNATYSSNAQKAVEKNPNVHLKTLTELERSAFDASEAMTQKVEVYERQDIFGRYIRLSGRLESHLTGRIRKSDITNFIASEIQDSGKSFTVFGDFGSGKTTLLEKLQYELAKAYLRRTITGVPIIVKLKELERYGDSLLQNSVRRSTLISLTDEMLEFAIENSMLILLLDGFDEISSSATAIERIEYLDKIGNFAFSNCPTVLTCRPTYFTSRREFHGLTSRYSMAKYSLASTNTVLRHNEDFVKKHTHTENKLPSTTIFEHTIDIDPLSEESIELFLETYKAEFKQKLNASVRKIRQFLSSVYDLKDLMTRPILLQMVVDTLLMGKMDINNAEGSYGPSSVYSLYTGTSFERDYQKSAGSQYLTASQREKFCRVLGTYFTRNEKLEVSPAKLEKLIKDSVQQGIFPKSKSKDIEKLLTDIRVCSFLRIAENDDLLFAHKSFAEFFTALEFIDALKIGAWKNHLNFNFNLETILFLSSFLIEDTEYQNAAFSQLRNKKLAKSAQRNLFCAICSVPDKFPSLRLKDRVISDIQFPSAIYKNYIFEETRFTRVHGKNLGFEKCKFESFEFNECEAGEINLSGCQGDVNFTQSDLTTLKVESEKVDVTFDRSNVDLLHILKHLEFRFAGDLWCQKLSAFNTSFLLGRIPDKDVQAKFGTVEAGNCVFEAALSAKSPPPEFLEVKNVKLIDNSFVGLALTAKCIENSFLHSEELDAELIKGNSGLLFVGGKLRKETATWLRDKNPNLVVLSYAPRLTKSSGQFEFSDDEFLSMKNELDDILDRKVLDRSATEFVKTISESFFSRKPSKPKK